MKQRVVSLTIRWSDWLRNEPCATGKYSLGRGGDCDIVLPDPTVSRLHASLTVGADGSVQFLDEGSTAGSFLGSKRLERSPVSLAPGERVRIGDTTLDFSPLSDALSRHYQALAHDPALVGLLAEGLGDLVSGEGLTELLPRLLARSLAVAGGNRGALLLSSESGDLEPVEARTASGETLPVDQVLTRTLPQQALDTGKPVVLDHVGALDTEDPAPASVHALGLESVICVPLPGPDGAVGVLYIDSPYPSDHIGEAELAALETLARQGAVSIERAKLQGHQLRRFQTVERELRDANEALRHQLGIDAPLGDSEVMTKFFRQLERLAKANVAVCLSGERGTLREQNARHLHRLSARRRAPFVSVHCGSLEGEAMEEELFGRGREPGRVAEAEGGTLFLEEVTELSAHLQSRILQLLKERSVTEGGETRDANVRIVASTSVDLESTAFSSDAGVSDFHLLLAGGQITVPPLRERGSDITLLAEYYLRRFGSAIAHRDFSRNAKDALVEHAWPGNDRELEHRIRRSCLLASRDVITTSDLGLDRIDDAPPEVEEQNLDQVPLQEARQAMTLRFERVYVEQLLKSTQGNMTEASERAGVSRQLLNRLVRRHEIDRAKFLPGGAHQPFHDTGDDSS